MIYFEDLPLGIKTDLGTYTFTEDDIIKFASRWDPQPFHTDPAAAQDSLEKMKQRVAGGVSPGFRDLKWLAPVRPGDTLHYYSTNTEKVELKSRPAFGILRSFNEAINQDGVSVMTFTGQGFMGRRPKKG
jgi:acyl dehydratase